MIRQLIAFISSFILFGQCLIMAQEIKDGTGKANLPDGSVYSGEFKNGLFKKISRTVSE